MQKHEGVRTDQYKLIHYYEIDEWEMFDFKTDLTETKNLYNDSQYADIQNDLKRKLDSLKIKYEVPRS